MSAARKRASEYMAPESEAAAAGLVREAFETGTPLSLCGGNTRAGYGKPVQSERTLSTSSLSGIVDYEPSELVMIALAGTPMSEVEAALANGRQRLAFEPMDHCAIYGSTDEPTIGAIAAGNISGPRRFLAGAARDSLLGARFVNGRGEIVKAGGRVMKNVTGLDLVKALAGSWGTLGLMTQVTFKVLPVTETEITLVIHGLTDSDAVKSLARAVATSNEPSGAAHLPASVSAKISGLGDAAATLLRVEGFEQSVKLRVDGLKAELAGMGEFEELDEKTSRTVWQSVRDCKPFAANDNPLWRISMAPLQGQKLISALGEGDAFYDWQGGLVWLQLQGDPQAERIRTLIERTGGGHATLVRAPLPVRAATPVFQPEPESVARLSERIRQQFDPRGIFNPGRMG